MEERYEEILGKYEFTVRTMTRTRGAFVLDTNNGIHILRPLDVSKKRVEFENKVTACLEDRGYTNVDIMIPNKEGMLVTENESGEAYIVKRWFRGDECRVREKEDLVQTMGNLGRLHEHLYLDIEEEPEPMEELIACGDGGNLRERIRESSLTEIFEKHNREMKRVLTYIRGKRQKNVFELCILKSYNEFYGRAIEGVKLLKSLNFDTREKEAKEEGQLCHGSYTYHNVLLLKDGIATVNFEKADYGFSLLDLYYFLRKAMEKNNWNTELGNIMINEYTRFHNLSETEIKILGVLLYYPEKYWKIVNHYFNSKKSWIAEKDMDKLDLVCEQEWQKTIFLKELFSLSF